ncbi:MAG: amidohydrolase [Ilumatobacteraceae bacterium]|jgi:hippurate hydrolase|nr:amidohydrolase [Ilumatobacteraceae bacterium]HAN34669.1 amidohydrolase [Acidimicrobiaceae bacterium]MBP9052845.1 amidohydrolase [Ilumatobacteraceae bacterium]HQY13337.1 amidohydrolase [Ilumatobacteraceae bacterium]HRA84718.1 amidohydrolase [Ilumatobacteraceae bacterium]
MLDDIPALLPELRMLYEDLHRHPELSFAEVRTAGIMADRLRALGYEVTTGVGQTGVVATLDNGDGATVLLRGDIDALPVKEATGLAYASTAVGHDSDGKEVPVAHACGHDMHATWLIGVATLLATHRDAWRGRVILAVQPAEEIGGGATAMIDDGLFERFGTPDVALGQHVAPAPAGWVLFRPGAVMTASDALKIVMHGRGAHGSTPEQSVDPVVMAAATVMKLQTVVARNIAATESAVVTVGTLHVGTKENIISDHAELTLSVRTFEPAVRDKVLAAISRIAHGEAHSCGAPQPPDITTLYSFPAVTNDADTTHTVGAAFVEHFGPERAMEGPVATASEDFGLFGARGGFPSMFWFVGGTDPELWQKAFAANRVNEDIPFNHSAQYAPVQDPTISTGIEAMLVAAMCWLKP